MKCPRCGQAMNPKSRTCKNCGARIVPKNQELARKMTMNSRISMAAGGLLVIIAGVLFFNGAFLFGGITLGVGVVLGLIGKMMG